MSDPALSAGHKVGPYRLTEMIGKGGFSQVWSAWDTRLNRVVAIKFVQREDSEDYNSAQQFSREAALIAQLEYAHVLPLYDFGDHGGYHYLVTRYVPGGSLAHRLMRDPLLPLSYALSLMTILAGTLDYIHQRNIVHRDLKPANILLGPQGLPYLADFGLAKNVTASQNSISGTFQYMSPEQLSGGALTTRSDIYSFGVMLYELLAGQLPHKGEMMMSVRALRHGETLPDITQANPNLPPALNDYLRQLTEPEPEKRPASATPIMQAINTLLLGHEEGVRIAAASHTATQIHASATFRQREAEILLTHALELWQQGEFRLSLTDFVLLDELRDQVRIGGDTWSLMLRGALEYDHQVNHWWARCNESERRKALWHALNSSPNVNTALRALSRAAPLIRVQDFRALNAAFERLAPLSGKSDAAMLDFLDQFFAASSKWSDGDALTALDGYLGAVAAGQSAEAGRAAEMIGRARRTRAALALAQADQTGPMLTVLETAGSLPRAVPGAWRYRLLLALRQLTRHPRRALYELFWAVLGNVLAFGLMVYTVFRSFDPLGTARLRETLQLGLTYGLMLAVGVWLARHIAGRLRAVPFPASAVLGILAGGLIVDAGFTLFQQFVYQDAIEPTVALSSGLLFVAGFAISARWPTLAQITVGAAGVALAYLIPWQIYLEQGIRPPFFFNEDDPASAFWLVGAAAVAVAVFTLGYRLLPGRAAQAQPAPQADALPTALHTAPDIAPEALPETELRAASRVDLADTVRPTDDDRDQTVVISPRN